MRHPHRPATTSQLDYLAGLGITEAERAGLTRIQASALIDVAKDGRISGGRTRLRAAQIRQAIDHAQERS